MSKNPDITNDDINEEIRSDNEDSINFFKGSEVVILHKNISEPVDEETQKMIDGLESLVKGFSASVERVEFNKLIIGSEARETDPVRKRSIIMTIVDEVIQFLKNVGNWIMSLLTNRIARATNKLRYLENRRKIKGIKTKKVNYLSGISALMMPSVVSYSPSWVIDATNTGLDFYKRTILAHKAMIDMITHHPNSREELKARKISALETIGRIVTNGKTSIPGFTSDILPGNKEFTVSIRTTERNSAPFYFTSAASFVKLKSSTWNPTPGIIDSGITLLNTFINEIKKEQSNTNTLNRNFERSIKAARKYANSWTIAYYNWLIEIHRKLISLTFQQTMRWYDTLEDFVSSGVR